MPQPTKGPRLGGSPAHQKMMLANLATSLFTHGRIHTTRAKAERLRPYAERLITKAKRGDLHNRRVIAQQIRDKDVVHRLVAEIGPFFADRAGGYTRIVKTLPRKGDNAPMAIIELVNERTASAEAGQATRTAARGGSEQGAVGGAATGAAATGATIAAAEAGGTADSGTETAGVAEATGGDTVDTTSEDAAVAEGTGADETVGATVASPEVPEAEAAAADAPADDTPADNTVTDLVTEPGDTDES